jgi:hypothetical protein
MAIFLEDAKGEGPLWGEAAFLEELGERSFFRRLGGVVCREANREDFRGE